MLGFLKVRKTFTSLAKSRAIINRRLKRIEERASRIEGQIDISLGVTTLFGLSILDVLVKKNTITIEEAIGICEQADVSFHDLNMSPADGYGRRGPWSSVAAELVRRSAAAKIGSSGDVTHGA
ncbi:MAG: hypothetical protein EKK43_13740 [Methylobacterium sp.]|uniref:hypothetical protein n=1 Tax=Methylobacterium sp. TaxID=409 RepID=UPI000F9431A6|nr:hypothetical protein [Methylobacterium sp.]RUP14040.1 MAG: hypothetical protein EKK43_13740 [Methylobacterium sp.]